MSREGQLEMKVGSFVLLAAIALTFFVISIGGMSFIKKGQTFEVIFGFANGLRDAAPVRLAGVEAGIVKQMKIFMEPGETTKTKVRALVWIEEGINIPVDSKITINQLGILGEKYIEIIPGISKEFIQPGAVLTGADPVPIEKITEQVSVITTKLEVTIDGINNGILTPGNKESIASILKSFQEIAAHMKDGRGTIGRLLMNESVYQNLDEMTSDLKSNPWKLLYRPKQVNK